ncbi:hypothetical protein C0Q70_09316 [Pomacea canaliculata]|uniref:PNPLA domain-containing protein n=1 Tax=Pomacea canaliculata TaxID=400727 RepID=A0A2T7P9F6_POMCA|nr:hypothetical protein C0Q70_09316 [Pomacea canaliculata]
MGNCSSKTVQLELDSDRSYDLIRAARQKYLEDSEIDSDEHIEPDTPVKPKQQFEQASITKKATTLDPRDYDYPFENLVLEGGGNKGIAYCGAIKVLEELDLWKNIRRLAGASAGAMTAALLAVGYNSDQLEKFLSQGLAGIFLDHKCGYCSLLPNLLTGYGWNPGMKIYDWFGQKLAEQDTKNHNPDITFLDVYKQFGKELCIVVTNLNQMSIEYFHPKTTPNVPVRLAVRMSMSIPGLFMALRHSYHGEKDIFVDGGVLCNYPIHCFDGWWLSMDPADSFLKRLQPLDNIHRLLDRTERFGTKNDRTLGMLLFADNERELLRYHVEARLETPLQELPNTRLASVKKKKKEDLQNETRKEHGRLVRAANAFLRVLEKHDINQSSTIDRSELSAALDDITYQELVLFLEVTGIDMQMRFLGYQRQEVNSFYTFLCTLESTLLTNIKRIHVEDCDVQRTVGINTGHVDTNDFVLEDEDKQFLLDRGRAACEAFLKYYAEAKDLQKRGSASDESSSKENLVTPEVVSSAKNSLAARDPENTNTSCPPLSSAVLEGSDDKMNESIETQITEECVPFLRDNKS